MDATATAERTTLPWGDVEEGWRDVEMADYLALPYVSSSILGAWRYRTPRYVRWLIEEGGADEETAAKTLGSLTHTAVLEPDLLTSLYVVEPRADPEAFPKDNGEPSTNPRATKAFRAAVAELEATGKIVVSHEAMRLAVEMRDAVHAHRRASQLLRAEGPVEATGVIIDPETGIPLKIRPDKLVVPIHANTNLKTSANADHEAWSADLFRYRYFVDFAFYHRALTALDFAPEKAIALVVDARGPKDDRVVVYELDEGTLDAGAQIVEKALFEIARCVERDTWPGHPTEIRSISLPPWAWSRVDDELSMEGRVV